MSNDMKITVDELITTPFSSRTQRDKERIVSEGRPTPLLEEHGSRKRKSDNVAASAKSLFDQFQWLTASVTTRSFCCWPCLLFQPSETWTGRDVSVVKLMAPEHEKTREHIESKFFLQTFIHQHLRIQNVQKVVPNTEALRRLVDVVCSLVSLQRNRDVLEDKNILRTVVLLRKYDSINKWQSDEAIKLLQGSPDIVNKIVDAIARVVRRTIFGEVRSCRYFSLILSQHYKMKSFVLRYVRKGKVKESFLGFTRVVGVTSFTSISKHIKNIVDEIGAGPKCIAVSVDGRLLSGVELKPLCRELKNDFPNCIFVPWHSHVIDVVLQQSLSDDPRCGLFFKSMAALQAYFIESPELCVAFNEFLPGNRLTDIIGELRSAGEEFATTEFLAYVRDNRRSFIMFVDAVVKTGGAKWYGDTVVKAAGFRKFLADPMIAFLLNVFAKIFELSSPLRTALDSPISERHFSKLIVSDLERLLNRMRYLDFETLSPVEMAKEELERTYAPLFDDIMKLVISEIVTRYNKLDTFQFCCLFDFLDEGWLERSPKHLRDIQKCYDLHFNEPLVHAEMELLYEHGAFSQTSVYDFHQYLHDSKLKHTFTSLFELSELILAMPFKRPSPTQTGSLLSAIGKWSDVPEPNPNDSSILFVEYEYLLELKKFPSFYDELFAVMAD